MMEGGELLICLSVQMLSISNHISDMSLERAKLMTDLIIESSQFVLKMMEDISNPVLTQKCEENASNGSETKIRNPSLTGFIASEKKISNPEYQLIINDPVNDRMPSLIPNPVPINDFVSPVRCSLGASKKLAVYSDMAQQLSLRKIDHEQELKDKEQFQNLVQSMDNPMAMLPKIIDIAFMDPQDRSVKKKSIMVFPGDQQGNIFYKPPNEEEEDNEESNQPFQDQVPVQDENQEEQYQSIEKKEEPKQSAWYHNSSVQYQPTSHMSNESSNQGQHDLIWDFEGQLFNNNQEYNFQENVFARPFPYTVEEESMPLSSLENQDPAVVQGTPKKKRLFQNGKVVPHWAENSAELRNRQQQQLNKVNPLQVFGKMGDALIQMANQFSDNNSPRGSSARWTNLHDKKFEHQLKELQNIQLQNSASMCQLFQKQSQLQQQNQSIMNKTKQFLLNSAQKFFSHSKEKNQFSKSKQ